MYCDKHDLDDPQARCGLFAGHANSCEPAQMVTNAFERWLMARVARLPEYEALLRRVAAAGGELGEAAAALLAG